MTQSIKTSGLLLKSIPYLGRQKILKVFTLEQGLVSLFAKNCKLAPFCFAEWIYLRSSKDIHLLQDSALLDPFLELKQDYNTLIAAGAIAQDLLHTQLPEKKAPELLHLAALYFKQLPRNPPILAASFRLKLLFHEGLLSPVPDSIFTPEEWEQVQILAFARKISQIAQVAEAPHAKINSLFKERFHRTERDSNP